jgi:hypothetical protein
MLPLLRRRLDEGFIVEGFTDCLGAGRKEERPLQNLRDALDAEGRASFLELDDLLFHRGRKAATVPGVVRREAGLTVLAIRPHPVSDRLVAYPAFLHNHRNREALFDELLDYLKLEICIVPFASLRDLPFLSGLLYTRFWSHG